jgi:hypothetical protein
MPRVASRDRRLLQSYRHSFAFACSFLRCNLRKLRMIFITVSILGCIQTKSRPSRTAAEALPSTPYPRHIPSEVIKACVERLKTPRLYSKKPFPKDFGNRERLPLGEGPFLEYPICVKPECGLHRGYLNLGPVRVFVYKTLSLLY